jgi:hypothetical protein
MNHEHKNIAAVSPDMDSLPEKKAYEAPNLRDLDCLETTKGGFTPSVLEVSGGAITS